MDTSQLPVKQIDALLPQTQCTKCGFNGCRPYAQAIVEGTAFNRCPPGGEATIAKLAHLLNEPIAPLDTSRGQARAVVAFVREDECIGCTKCIQACPVDAIIGAAQQMHTVISDYCTGCELCIAPCPVDCIDLIAVPAKNSTSTPDQLRGRYENRNSRLRAQQTKPLTSVAICTPTISPTVLPSEVNSNSLLIAHTTYAKAEKLYRDAEHAAKQACKRGHQMSTYQEKLDRLATNVSIAKQHWERLKLVTHPTDSII